MTLEELKTEAKKLGYKVTKIPPFDCSCYAPYPNKTQKHKNGRWKCVDDYEKIDYQPKSKCGPCTHCKKATKSD